MQDWHVEAAVQERIRDHYLAAGWQLLREADTAAGQRGIDLLFLREPAQLWALEVKGFPLTVYAKGRKKGQPKPTPPNLQAKHWFAQALFQAVNLQGEHPGYLVSIGLPDKPIYRKLLDRTAHAFRKLGIGVVMVAEGGEVTEFLSPTATDAGDRDSSFAAAERAGR